MLKVAEEATKPAEKLYLIPESILVAVKSYLFSRPYQEVAVGVKMLDGLQPYEPMPAPRAVGEKE